MNTLIHRALLIIVAVMVGSGCAVTEGPRPPTQSWTMQHSDVKEMADCESQYPNVKGIWDPLTGYFMYTGADAENNRKCLIEKYGWFELGPPEFAKGTMAPPRRLWR